MKKLIKTLSDPYTLKVAASMSVICIGVYMLGYACLNEGANQGGNLALSMAEKMDPGFIEKFQKYVAAERYGWKS